MVLAGPAADTTLSSLGLLCTCRGLYSRLGIQEAAVILEEVFEEVLEEDEAPGLLGCGWGEGSEAQK